MTEMMFGFGVTTMKDGTIVIFQPVPGAADPIEIELHPDQVPTLIRLLKKAHAEITGEDLDSSALCRQHN